MQDSCPFCDATIKQRTLWEDELTVTFLSNPRLMQGHTLVIPKRHVEKPWELTHDELMAIFKNLWKVEKRLIASGLGQGCDVRQHYRPFMPQGRVKVNHVHFHALPRTLSDELFQTSMQFEDFVDLSDEECASIAKTLKS